MARQAVWRFSTLLALVTYAVITGVLRLERRRAVFIAAPAKGVPSAVSLHRGLHSPVKPPEAEKESHVSKGWWALLMQAGSQWVSHKDARLGAALAYYSIFSIGPLIVVVISIAGFIFEEEAVRGEVSAGLKGLLGESGARAVNNMLAAADRSHQGVFATIIGVGALIFAAIGVVVQLKDALNTVWDVKALAAKGLWGFARNYVLSFAGVLSLGFLLLISMLLTTALSAASRYLGTFFPEVALQAAGSAASFFVIAFLFALMFKWLPDAKVAWADVWLGAVLTAALFELGKFLIALYIGKQGLESTYGAAASLVIVLIWVYYAAQIVLFGAEFTNAHSKQRKTYSGHVSS
ncbi:MAG TPA: YihY/virulence factor BrkB family protein [Pirellulales bacterium]|jgi:membrane protein|nr:YihY/virulence factor BrkB family protein [Pirellulales bacterium]